MYPTTKDSAVSFTPPPPHPPSANLVMGMIVTIAVIVVSIVVAVVIAIWIGSWGRGGGEA